MDIRRYLIFLSSTFRDMDAERDSVKFHVINRLNRKYRQYNISFQVVDLRVGINTEILPEDEGENKVLEVCLSKIDQARPFFVGLLGSRYGWCPDNRRIADICRRLDGSGDAQSLYSGCSVTEIEILHAISQKSETAGNAVFFIRSADSYSDMPAHLRSAIDDSIDSSGQGRRNAEKLASLKERLRAMSRQFGCPDIHDYTLRWNKESGAFDGLDRFADSVYEAICAKIDAQLGDLCRDNGWHCAEKSFVDSRMQTLASFSTGAPAEQQPYSGGSMIISGDDGSGKSVLLSKAYCRLRQQPGNIVLAAIAGATDNSLLAERIMARWIAELGQELGAPDCTIEHTAALGRNELIRRLHALAEQASRRGRTIYIVIDSLERFRNYNPDDALAGWLPPAATLLATADRDTAARAAALAQARIVETSYKSPEFIGRLISVLEQYHAIELPQPVADDILALTPPPRRIALLFRFLSNLSSSTFRTIRSATGSKTEIEKINDYISRFYYSAPASEPAMLDYVLSSFTEAMDIDNRVATAVRLIAASRVGLTEKHITDILGPDFNIVDFHLALSLLSDYITEHPYSHSWQFNSATMAGQYLSASGSDATALAASIARAIADDPEKDDHSILTGIYTAIVSADSTLVARLTAMPIFTPSGASDHYPYAIWDKAALLLNDSDAAYRSIETLVQTLPPEHAVRMLYLLNRVFLPAFSTKLETLLPGLLARAESLAISERYALAWTLGSICQKMRLSHIRSDHKRLYLETAEELYASVMAEDSGYHDAANMHPVMLMELMTLYSDSADMENFEKVMQKLADYGK